MNDSAISINDVALDYPRKKKGVGLLREFITGRFKKIPRKDRWFRALNGTKKKKKSRERLEFSQWGSSSTRHG